MKHGVGYVGEFAVEVAAIATGREVMAFEHAESGNSAPSPRPDSPGRAHGMINLNGQRPSCNTHQLGTGIPDRRPAPSVRRPNQTSASNQNRPSRVVPPNSKTRFANMFTEGKVSKPCMAQLVQFRAQSTRTCM